MRSSSTLVFYSLCLFCFKDISPSFFPCLSLPVYYISLSLFLLFYFSLCLNYFFFSFPHVLSYTISLNLFLSLFLTYFLCLFLTYSISYPLLLSYTISLSLSFVLLSLFLTYFLSTIVSLYLIHSAPFLYYLTLFIYFSLYLYFSLSLSPSYTLHLKMLKED